MLLRYSRFYLSGDQHYYEHIRLPQQQMVLSVPLGSPTFMCYLIPARNRILPRVSLVVPIVVLSQQDNRLQHLRENGQYH
jgi:hypothetical protein